MNKILGVFLLPFLFLKVAFNGLMLPVAKNCIKKNAPLKRNRFIKISDDFIRDDFDKSCKLHKCTFT